MQFLDNPDPTGRRCGEAPLDHFAETITKTLENAKTTVSKDQVAANKALSKELLSEALNDIKGAITIAYPMGLPEHEPIKYILEDDEDLSQSAASKDVFDASQTSLWWANKELVASKKLFEFIGKNEKTKIVVKIQKVILYILVYCCSSAFRKDRDRLSEKHHSTKPPRRTSWRITLKNRSKTRYFDKLSLLYIILLETG
jgi:hypothetical protein